MYALSQKLVRTRLTFKKKTIKNKEFCTNLCIVRARFPSSKKIRTGGKYSLVSLWVR